MTKKSKINKKELAAILRESIFTPSKPGPMKVIIDVGDSRYYRQRALELITLSLESPTVDQCEYYLEQAITLLAVAKHVIRLSSKEVEAHIPENWKAETLAKQTESIKIEEEEKCPVCGDKNCKSRKNRRSCYSPRSLRDLQNRKTK